MFRRPLMVLLGLGVVFGYGGALASFRHHGGGECHRWEDRSDWQRGDPRADRFNASPPSQAAAPVIVQAPAAPQSPVVTPQVFIIMSGATQAVPAVVQTVVAPAAAPKSE